jgi:cytosine/adenosine deaminase-related metal-dependent hydrolase
MNRAILLKNATYIDWGTLDFQQTNILVNEGLDNSITFANKTNEVADKEHVNSLDCSGKLVTKAFAVGHHHVYSALARGMPAPKKTPANFYEKLKYVWWNIDKALDAEMIRASALATAIACAKAGSAFVIDHHASPNAITGSLDIIAEAFEKVGISHLLCYEITDRDGIEKAEKGLSETENYLKKNQALVGLHASFTVGDETMQKAADLIEKYQSGMHIHVAEDLYDQKHCSENYNKRVVERLNDFGLLNSPKTILGHCLHLSDNERFIIKNSKAFVVQNMDSNLNNKVGYFNSEGLGKNIFLGTDGMHSDMIKSAQSAHFMGQNFDEMNFGDANFRLRNVHNYLKINNFKGDGDNNLIVLDYSSPTPISKENFLGHFLFGFSSNDVLHVISDGKLIVKDRKIQTINEKEVLKFANEQAVRLWEKLV